MKKGGFAYQKTPQELRAELAEQLVFMRHAAHEYESNPAYAKELSARLYILFHDGGVHSKSKALLGQLNLLSSLALPSTAAKIDPTLADSFLPLTHIRLDPDGGAEFCAPLGKAVSSTQLVFSDWWNEVVYTPDPALEMSRKEIVLAMRSQDGGSHVDNQIGSQAYRRLQTVGAGRNTFTKHDDGIALYHDGKLAFHVIRETPPPDKLGPTGMNNNHFPIKNGHLATVRQIAWEADEALKALGY